MAKLRALASRLQPMQSRVYVPRTVDQREAAREAQPWRKWYQTARWRALRNRIILRDAATCQWPGCGRVCAEKGEATVDHIRPHRGDAALFWDEGNLQLLCKACHDGPKAAAERDIW